MVVRGAKYPRKENDLYSTPPEATRVLLDTVRFGRRVVDPACGDDAIVKVLREYDYVADGSDLALGYDFLTSKYFAPGHDIVTNPPFGIGGRTAAAFIERALQIVPNRFAMLLPVDFDSGITRRHLFGDCPAFAMKIVLLNRIRWFNGQSGSINHAWFIWQADYTGLPTLKYAAQTYQTVPKVLT